VLNSYIAVDVIIIIISNVGIQKFARGETPGSPLLRPATLRGPAPMPLLGWAMVGNGEKGRELS